MCSARLSQVKGALEMNAARLADIMGTQETCLAMLSVRVLGYSAGATTCENPRCFLLQK
jgi:hypothetical protein